MPLTTQAAHRKDINTGISDMQHRHFATVAAIIRSLPMTDADRECVAEHFAGELRYSNPKFDRKRFLAACKEI